MRRVRPNTSRVGGFLLFVATLAALLFAFAMFMQGVAGLMLSGCER